MKRKLKRSEPLGSDTPSKCPRSSPASDSDPAACAAPAVGLEQLPDDILLAIYRDVARTEGIGGLVRSLGAASRRLRSLCWQKTVFEEPELGPADTCSVRLLELCLRRGGEHVRKLCLSGLFLRRVNAKRITSHLQIHKLLSLTPGLTRLSLAHMCILAPYPGREDLTRLEAVVIRRLPPLPSLHTLNLSDTRVSSDALRALLTGASATLQCLYLSNTLIEGSGNKGDRSTPHYASVMRPLAGMRLPRLRALDVSHSVVEAGPLVEFVNAHPSLSDLYLAKLRSPPALEPAALKTPPLQWDRFLKLPAWSLDAYPPVFASFERRAALTIFDSELHQLAGKLLFGEWDPAKGAELVSALSRVPRDACAGIEARTGDAYLDGRTPFLSAMEHGHFKFARDLEQAGADVCAVCRPYPHFAASPAKRWGSPFPFFPPKDPPFYSCRERVEGGSTALHALNKLYYKRSEEPEQDPRVVAQELRALGLAPLRDARSPTGNTPLHVHASDSSSRFMCRNAAITVSALLALGSDPFLQDRAGDNALFSALRTQDPCDEVVRALLTTHPGLVHTTDAQGRSLARLVTSTEKGDRKCIAVRRPKVVGALLDAGAISWGEDAAALLRLLVAGFESSNCERDLETVLGILRSLLSLPGADPRLTFPGMDPNARGEGGRTALMDAVNVRHQGAVLHVAALLAVPGVDLDARDDAGRTALHHAAVRYHSNNFLALLRHPVDVNAVDGEGMAVLHRLFSDSVCDSTAERLKKLVERPDLDPNLADRSGCTPLFLAIKCRPQALARLKRNYGDDRRRVLQLATPIKILLGRPDLDVNATAEDGQTAFWRACADGDWDAAEVLLAEARGLDVRRAPPGRPAPVFLALRPTPSAAAAAVNASANAKPAAGRTSTLIAKDAEGPRGADVAARLIARGAYAGAVDEFGMSALHYAVTALDGAALVEAVVEAGAADAGALRAACAARNPKGRTPFMLACLEGRFEAASGLLPHSDAAAQARLPALPPPRRRAESSGVHAQDAEGNGALHLSADLRGAAGLSLLREVLAACPAAARAQNIGGDIPLHVHAAREPWTSESAPEPAGAPEGLEGAARAFVAASDLLASNAGGRTPLHVAASGAGAGPLLRAMLEAPQAAAALCAQDKLGATPLHVACRGGRDDVVNALLGCVRRAGAAAALELRDAGGLRPVEAAPAALLPLFREGVPSQERAVGEQE
eukprot:tig00000042_g15481.t1